MIINVEIYFIEGYSYVESIEDFDSISEGIQFFQKQLLEDKFLTLNNAIVVCDAVKYIHLTEKKKNVRKKIG